MVEILTHPAAVLAQTAAAPDTALSQGLEFLTHPAATFFALVALAALVAIVAIVATQWSKVRRAELDTALKHDMLQRGMGADEIERVLRASQSPAPEAEATLGRWVESGFRLRLAARMAKEGYNGGQIVTVLGALEERGRPLNADECEAIRAMVKEGYGGDHIATMIRALPRAAATTTAAVPESGHPANVG